VTSRLLEKPVSVALKGPSSGGKSYVLERVLSFFPEGAYYALTAMSDRTLAYSEEPIKHRFLVIYEAAGMSGEFATYLMRSLLSEGCVRYETVEKTSEGMKPRLIEREGPTGLIVTTTAVKLHPENETRLLSLVVTDTQDQTRAVMAALAREAGEAGPTLEVWHALQVWLESAEHRVCIPYAMKLAQLIPPVAVRLRRDFGAVLNLIRAHALLHQASRERDAEGRIVATIEEDYAAVRELVADLVSEGIEATVPETVRESVEAVKRLREDSNGEPVTVAELARELKLDRSAVSRRVRNAKDRGYLRDLEESQRKPSRLVLGDNLPDDLQILPKPEDVRVGMQERALGSARPDGAQEPHGNGQNWDDAYKACNRAPVQEGIKHPPPPGSSEPGEPRNPEDDTLKEEVRDLFAQDALEEV
jgi:DNA-binding transcriptional ArsR family regulator